MPIVGGVNDMDAAPEVKSAGLPKLANKPEPILTWNCMLPEGTEMPTGPLTEAETVTELPKVIGLDGMKVEALTLAVALFTVRAEAAPFALL